MCKSSALQNKDIAQSSLSVQGGKVASSYGFSPQADAETNVAALQAALNGGGIITVDTPGIYDLNDTIFLDSNTKLLCAPGVIFRKVSSYCNVLINRGALTKEYNDNITIDGLEISVNGMEAPPTLVYGLRAQVGFFYVRNLTIRNFTCVDGEAYQFLMYIVTWSHLHIENVRLAGDKDGIKLNNGHDAILHNVDLTTYDDGLSLCGTDFQSVLVEVGDVYNVFCSNITDHQYKRIFGRTCMIYTGSWADYKAGNTYGTGDFCLHQGKLYQVSCDRGFLANASDAPVHSHGLIAGADGIPWRFIQHCNFYKTDVYNVTFDNCIFEKSGNIIAYWITPKWLYEKGGVHRTTYPGTERDSSAWGFSITNCKIVGKNPQILINVMGNMKDVIVSGCYFNNPRSTVINVDPEAENEELVATINGCMFVGMGAGLDSLDTRSEAPLPDHQNCSMLRRDMEDAGKFAVIHNGGTLTCSAAGNAYRGSEIACSATNGSQMQFLSTDLPT